MAQKDILLRLAEFQKELTDSGNYYDSAVLIGDAIVEIACLRSSNETQTHTAALIASENEKYAKYARAKNG